MKPGPLSTFPETQLLSVLEGTAVASLCLPLARAILEHPYQAHPQSQHSHMPVATAVWPRKILQGPSADSPQISLSCTPVCKVAWSWKILLQASCLIHLFFKLSRSHVSTVPCSVEALSNHFKHLKQPSEPRHPQP